MGHEEQIQKSLENPFIMEICFELFSESTKEKIGSL